MPKGKLRHVAMSVKDPHKTAEFYKEALGMEQVGETDSDIATGVFLSDGVINLELLKFKTDEMAQGSSRGAVVKAYHMVRGSAGKNINAALPALGAMVQKYS